MTVVGANAARDEVLSHALSVLRYSAHERGQLRKTLEQLTRDLQAILSAVDLDQTSRRQITDMLVEAQRLVRAVYTDYREQMVGRLATLAEIETGVAVRTLNVAMPAAGASFKASPGILRTLATDILIQGAPSAEWWARQADDTVFRFRNIIRQGMANGSTVAAMSRAVRQTMDVSRRNADALVRSSVMAVSNAARLAGFKANADLVSGVQQVSTLDDRTTDICIAYDGQAWDLEGNPIRGTTLPFNGGPPRHWSCRSTLVPITKTWKELGVDIPEFQVDDRAASGGPTSGTFADWLSGQSEGVQDKMLGKGRARLWRDGSITLQQLLSFEGAPLTLAQLSAR